MPVYPHLLLRELGQASREFRPNAGGSNPERPRAIANRGEHAKKLRGDLRAIAEAVADASTQQRALGYKKAKVGLPVTVVGVADESLRIGGRRESRGIPLFGLGRRGGGERDAANVFLTTAAIDSLEQALDKYVAWREGDRPRRFNLFETTATFTISDVKDLWQDDPGKLPGSGESFEWEVWLRPGSVAAFTARCAELDLDQVGMRDVFIDAEVMNVVATIDDMRDLIRTSAAVVELRPASTFAADYAELDPEERVHLAGTVLARIEAAGSDAPSTVMVDTGTNHNHPMIGVALDEGDCRAIEADWPTNDHAGHGTQMAGIALYGDVQTAVEGRAPIGLTTRLESIVVTAPSGAEAVPARDAVERAVRIVEERSPDARRVFCLAATAPGDHADGRPTGASMMVDQLAWNDGRRTRLFCVAAGNLEAGVDLTYPIGPYDERNKDFPIQAPGQATNALTVGASTAVCGDFDTLAPEGDLCPSSRTSQAWEERYANKPDIVMEGGNHEIDRDGLFSHRTQRSMLLTTGRNYPRMPFQFTGETSAATARAAGLSTRLAAHYPSLRPETLRALMVNSARWTPAMDRRRRNLLRLGMSDHDAYAALLDCYGWGVPDEERLFQSAADALTLVIEDDLRPYVERVSPSGSKRICLREMKTFRPPWPSKALAELGSTPVEMRCTLSYFVEPDPGGAARRLPERYASHRLRFAVKTPNATVLEAMQRINQLASEEDLDEPELVASVPGLRDRDSGWTVGPRRNAGSIHQDVWKGSASDLANRDMISVYPVRGWWAEGRDATVWNRRVRFSLVVSIETPPADVDITADALAVARARGLIDAPVSVRARRRP